MYMREAYSCQPKHTTTTARERDIFINQELVVVKTRGNVPSKYVPVEKVHRHKLMIRSRVFERDSPFLAFTLGDHPRSDCLASRPPYDVLQVGTEILVELRKRNEKRFCEKKKKKIIKKQGRNYIVFKRDVDSTHLEVLAGVSGCFLNIYHEKCGRNLENLRPKGGRKDLARHTMLKRKLTKGKCLLP